MSELLHAIADLSVSPEAAREYEETLLRWLSTKREYPWLNEPEPMPDNFWLPFLCRDRIMQEFQRSAA